MFDFSLGSSAVYSQFTENTVVVALGIGIKCLWLVFEIVTITVIINFLYLLGVLKYRSDNVDLKH